MSEHRPLRIAVLGAFAFPSPQGSQIFAAEQARALRDAGADPQLLTYGWGHGPLPPDLPILRAPSAFSPRSGRSGFHWLKPIADAALLATCVRSHRQQGFDVVLAHNAEAAGVALALRRRTGVPVVYVVHTLWGQELSSYAPSPLARGLPALGRRIDHGLARRADAIITLCEAAAAELRPHATGEVSVIPPGLPATPTPSSAEQTAVCARLSLKPGRFALYTGNLDAYQNLELLCAVGQQFPSGASPLVVATHDRSEAPRRAPGLHCVELDDFESTRALSFAAGVLLLPRALPGGFPIKLLNYMETGRPIVACAEVAEALAHERSAVLLPADAPPSRFAAEITALLEDAERSQRLGRAALEELEAQHRWPELAQRTLDVVRRVVGV